MLAELIASLDAAGVSLRFAELKDPAKDRLKRYGLFETLGAHAFFPTVGSAVDAYVAESGIEWVDWEERGGGRSRPTTPGRRAARSRRARSRPVGRPARPPRRG